MKRMDLVAGILKHRLLTPPPEVEKPTYEIVGSYERIDASLVSGFRDELVPGTPEWDSFYSLHPELEEIHAKSKRIADKQFAKRIEADPVNARVPAATFYGQLLMGFSNFLDGEYKPPQHLPGVAWGMASPEDPVNVSPEEMSKKIKGFGLYLGVARVRIAKANPDWLYSNYPMEHATSSENLAPNIDEAMAKYKYIICLAVPQNMDMLSTRGDSNLQAAEQGRVYALCGLISDMIAHYIRSLGWSARSLPPGPQPYLIVPTFVDAGIGEIGRCGFVVSKEVGNNFRPGAIATDMPLVPDKPVDFGVQDFCEKCLLCAEFCPCGAIPKGGRTVNRGIKSWWVDSDLCRRYWDSSGVCCSNCQVVCPWSHSSNWFHNIMRQTMEKAPFLRRFMIGADKIFYRYRFNPEPEWLTIKPVK
jgi:reductive dehalogenase